MTQQVNVQSSAKEEASVEDSFRESISDAIAILEGLAPSCNSLEEMVDILKLAEKNSSQLSLIMQKVMPVRLKGK